MWHRGVIDENIVLEIYGFFIVREEAEDVILLGNKSNPNAKYVIENLLYRRLDNDALCLDSCLVTQKGLQTFLPFWNILLKDYINNYFCST